MKASIGPIIHLSTVVGVVLGGIVWLTIYANNVGSIEFDGPAFTGLALGLIAGAVSGGIVGAVYDIKHKKGLIKTVALFVLSAVVSGVIVGSLLVNYAQNKWDYAGTHKEECQTPQYKHRLACQ
ncbi:MAG TPA: hypothetical protein VK674_05160 [Candidatus Limnocylindria bacterium]|nr:hypothetical protein [Candidatus Limnocylindria bacterium]